MAKGKYKGINIKFNADATELGNALRDIDKQSKEVGKNIRSVNNALKFDPKNTDLLGQKFKSLGQQIEITQKRLKTLTAEKKNQEQAFKSGKISEEEYKAFQNELTRTENSLKSLQRQAKITSDKINTEFKTALGNVKNDIKAFTKVVAAGEAALVGFSAKAVKTGMAFESSMSQVGATMAIDNTSKDFENLSNAAKEMGATTSFSASQAADALNYLALAGYDADKAVETLPKTLTLAKAGGMDLATASDMMTDAMSALGLKTDKTDKYINEMAKTAQKSNTNVAQLGEATLTCAGAVSTTGQSLETMNTSLGVLADNGLKGAEGGTHLRNVLLSLANPTDQAKKLFEKLGVSVTDNEGKIRDLNDIMTDLNKVLSNANGERTQQLGQIFNKTDLNAVNALLKSTTGRFTELKNEVSNADGAADQMAKTMADNLAGDLTTMKSEAEALQIAISEKLTPSLREAAQHGNDELNELIDRIESGDLAGTFENLGEDFSDMLVKGIDTAVQALPTVIKFLTLIMKHIEAIGRAYLAIKITDKTKAITSNLTNLASGLKNLHNEMRQATAAQSKFTAVAGGLCKGVISLSGFLIEGTLAFKSYVDNMSVVPDEYEHLNDEQTKLIKGLNRSTKEIQNFAEEFEKSSKEISAQGEVSSQTADEVFNLAGKQHLTADETAQLKAKVEELDKAIPGLNLRYDENTGKLNKNRKQVQGAIDDYTRLKTAQLAAEKAAKIKLSLAEGEEDFNKLKNQVDGAKKAYEESSKALKEYSENREKYIEKMGTYGSGVNEYNKKLNELTEANKKNSLSYQELCGQYQKVKDERQGDENKLKRLNDITVQNTKKTKENSSALKASRKAVKENISQLSELTAVLEKVRNKQALSKSQVDKLKKAYPELAKSIKSTKDGYTVEESAIKKVIDARTKNLKLIAEERVQNAKRNLTRAQQSFNSFVKNTSNTALKTFGATYKKLQNNVNKAKKALTAARKEAQSANAAINKATTTVKTPTNKTASPTNKKKTSVKSTPKHTTAKSELTEIKNETSSSSTSADTWGDAAKEKIAEADHKLAMDIYTEQQYYDRLKQINEKYYAGRKKYLSEYRSIEEKLYAYSKKKYQDEVDGKITALKNQLELGKINELDYYKKLDEINKKYYQNKKQYAQEYADLQAEIQKGIKQAQENNLNNIIDLTEKTNELISAQNKMKNAEKSKKIRFTKERGFYYDTDVSAVEEAKTNLYNAEKSLMEAQVKLGGTVSADELSKILSKLPNFSSIKIPQASNTNNQTITNVFEFKGDIKTDDPQEFLKLIENYITRAGLEKMIGR